MYDVETDWFDRAKKRSQTVPLHAVETGCFYMALKEAKLA